MLQYILYGACAEAEGNFATCTANNFYSSIYTQKNYSDVVVVYTFVMFTYSSTAVVDFSNLQFSILIFNYYV